MIIPMWNKNRPEVPVDKNGNWSHYPNLNCDYVLIEPFYAELYIAHMNSGRSAKWLTMTDAAGKEYPMFVADLVKFIQKGNVTNGCLKGKWTACKRGQNYGIQPA